MNEVRLNKECNKNRNEGQTYWPTYHQSRWFDESDQYSNQVISDSIISKNRWEMQRGGVKSKVLLA